MVFFFFFFFFFKGWGGAGTGILCWLDEIPFNFSIRIKGVKVEVSLLWSVGRSVIMMEARKKLQD